MRSRDAESAFLPAFLRQKVLGAIPDMSVVGLFEIHCSEIRKVLASRHRKIVELLEDMLLQRFRDSAQEVADTFQGIFAQLRKAWIKVYKHVYKHVYNHA